MRSYTHKLVASVAPAAILIGAVLAGYLMTSQRFDEAVPASEVKKARGETLALVDDLDSLSSESSGEEDLGYGYVEAVPDDAALPLDPEEKAVAMEGAALLARLGGGWAEGEMLADDLRLLVASARSQLDMYQEGITRMREDGELSAEVLDGLQASQEAASQSVDAFVSAGDLLRQRMLEMKESLERIEAGD